MTGTPVALVVAIAAVALGLSVLLAAAEAAVLGVTRTAVTDRIDPREPARNRVLALIADPLQTRAALRCVRIVAEVVVTVSAVLVVAQWLEEWWQLLILALIGGLLIAVLAVRVGRWSLGRRYPVPFLRILSVPLTLLVKAVSWLVPVQRADGDSERDLQHMVERVNDSGVIEEEERELIRSVFELGSTLTREVMVPRTDMITVARDVPLRKVLSLFLRSGFSRIPVTGTSTDDLVGVVFFKDVVRIMDADPTTTRRVADLARPTLFVPESKPVDDLLRALQSSTSHMAMVVDEYGGIAGLVTIEDALEEIVGELTDEHDRPEPEAEPLGDGTFRVPARLGLDELGELFEMSVQDDDVDTAGGLLAKALGKVPLPGSAGEIHGLRLVAESAQGRRKQLATLVVSLAPLTEKADLASADHADD